MLFLRIRSMPWHIWLNVASMLMPVWLTAQNNAQVMEQNKKTVKQHFDKWARGEGSFFDLLHEDVKWTITGKSPISKRYVSKKQFIEEAIIPLNKRLLHPIVPAVRSLYADGNTVIVLWDGKATALDGAPYDNTYSWYMEMHDGKITEAVAFFDTIDLAELWTRIPLNE